MVSRRAAVVGAIVGGLGVFLAVTWSDWEASRESEPAASAQYDAEAVRVNKAPS